MHQTLNTLILLQIFTISIVVNVAVISMGIRIDVPQLAIVNASETIAITVIVTIILIILNVMGYYLWNNVRSTYIQLKKDIKTNRKKSETRDEVTDQDIFDSPKQYSNYKTVKFNPYNETEYIMEIY